MHTTRTKDGGAIITCSELEAPIVLTALKRIFPKINEILKETIRTELRRMIYPKNPCNALCHIKKDHGLDDFSECDCHKCPVDMDNWRCILEQLAAWRYGM